MIWKTCFFKLKQGCQGWNLTWKEGNVTWCMAMINQDRIDHDNGRDLPRQWMSWIGLRLLNILILNYCWRVMIYNEVLKIVGI
jgi:hypothetical protein